MKIRIDESSIRFRLNDAEWSALLTNGSYTQSTRLPGSNSALTYSITHSPEIPHSRIAHHGTILTAQLAQADWDEISDGKRESIRCVSSLDALSSTPFTFIIEKDIPVSRKRTASKPVSITNEL